MKTANFSQLFEHLIGVRDVFVDMNLLTEEVAQVGWTLPKRRRIRIIVSWPFMAASHSGAF